MSAFIETNTGSYEVYLGFWTNWSHGKIQGATITLSKQNGGLLISFLALFVSATGTSFWRICCLIIHTVSSKPTPQDGVYHQLQAVLRNSSSAHQALVNLLMIGYAWPKPHSPFRRILPLSLLSLLLAAIFSLSGILSSRVTTDSVNEVLLSGKKCGIFASTPLNQNMTQEDVTRYLGQRETVFLARSLQCYSNSSALKSDSCMPYIKPNLPYTMEANAPCPFDEKMCRSKQNLILDTGFLNSHDHLGINAPTQKRFHFRQVVSCAPLVVESFSQVHMNSKDPKIPVMRYYYGEEIDLGEGDVGLNRTFTYQVPMNLSLNRLDNFTSFQGFVPDYLVDSKSMTHNKLITPLQRADATVSLYFLSAPGIAYLHPTNDPWFSAHKNTSSYLIPPHDPKGRIPLLNADEPAGVLGCASQVQFCGSDTSKCQQLSSELSTYNASLSDLWPDADGQVVIEWARTVLMRSFSLPYGTAFGSLGSAPLLARFTVSSGLQVAELPSNQWQLELKRLFEAQLASYQDAFVTAANGPFSSDMETNYVWPKKAPEFDLCHSQKVFSASYYSFNVLGLSIILTIGAIVMALDLGLVSIIELIDKRRKIPRHTYSRLEWQANSVLQLQRLAHEELGLGSWRNCTKDIPITESNEYLGLLDIIDEIHPRLVRPLPPTKEEPTAVFESDTVPCAEIHQTDALQENSILLDVGAAQNSSDHFDVDAPYGPSNTVKYQ